MMEGLGKKDSTTALLASIKEETQSIVSLRDQFEELLSEDDVPLSFTLLNIPGSLIYQERVLVERGGLAVPEGWFFVTPPQIEAFSPKLPQSTKESVEALALKLGIEPEVVMKAAIRIKVLTEDFRNPTCVSLDGGPEGMRLVEVMLPSSLEDGIFRQSRKGYSLEYYSCFEEIREKPVRVRLARIDFEELNFQVLFPGTLVFSAHMANKRQLSQSRVEPAAGLS